MASGTGGPIRTRSLGKSTSAAEAALREFLVGEVAIWVVDEPSGAWSGKHPLHGRIHRWRRRQFRGIRGDVGGRGLILVLDSDPYSNLFIGSVWCGSSLLGHDQDVFPGHIRPGTRSWRSKGVAAVHPAVTTVKALAMDVAAKEATTRTVATKRSTVWCIAAAEAAIPVQATLTAVAEVLTASSSQTESPVRKTEAPAFPSTNRAKAKARYLYVLSRRVYMPVTRFASFWKDTTPV
nr:uncharacterized protein LOC120969920 isoform X2 [Aegilops tauschii subsp. strangulata]